ncbi:PAS domain S-box protein [Microcoleus sp. FACHB-68]|uniref:PAS domain S-box protein n=1 Tax=Microcoleus sp. FACHB-68 TaxID=2692826 RepID=UPI00168446F1|nr:PAS domain S-box protein [Microcoleus sp. FACHB-68]MBD1939667.1 PAS domain S-box protein [Microcoleus sp. FACHB-68]
MTLLPTQTLHCNPSDRSAPSLMEDVFRLYERALDATSTGIVIADATQPDQPLVYCNRAFERITGYLREEIIGRNCRFLQGPDPDPVALQEIRCALREERDIQIILKNYRKDGTAFWNELSISPVRDAEGRVTHFIGVQTEITHRKQAEEALRQTEAKYRSIFENSTEGIFQTATDGRYLSANPALARIYGYDSPEELMGCCVAHKIYVDSSRRTEFTHHIREQGSVSNFEAAIYRADGSEIWISENAWEVRNQQGELLYYEGTVMDITQRKQAEAALRNQEYWLNTLIDAVPDAVTLKDSQGRWVVANQSALQLFGLESVDYHGKTDDALAPYISEPHKHLLAEIRQIDGTASTAGNHHTKTLPQPDASSKVYDTRKVPLFNPDGSRKGLVVVSRDITDRIAAEAALRDSEKRFRTIFEGAVIGMGLASVKGQKLIATNPAFQTMLGYTESELRGMTFNALTHPDDADLEGDWPAKGEQNAYQSEKRFICKNGSIRWVRLSVSPLRNAQGQVQFILGVVEDITNAKQAAVALFQHEAKWRSLIRHSSDIITITDAEGTILYASPSVSTVLRYPPEEMVGQYAFEFVHPEDLPQALANHERLTSKPAVSIPQEYRLRRADGSWCFLEAVSVNLLEDPAVRGIVINSRDITSRKQVELRLSKINECFLGFGTNAVENIHRLTALAGELLGGDCALYNRLEKIGQTQEKPLLHSVGQWHTPANYCPVDRADGHICYDVIQQGNAEAVIISGLQNTIYAETDPCVASYGLQTYIGQAVRRGETYLGSLCVVYTEPVTFTEADQKLMGIVAAAIGVEEERAAAAGLERQRSKELEMALRELQQTQLQLIQTEKMSSLGQLVAGVAHEINNPIGFVTGNLSHATIYIQDLLGLVELYQQEYPEQTARIQQEVEEIELDFLMQDLPKLLDSMKMGAERICEIVRTLKNFSRLDEAEVKPVNIHEGIDNTLLILHNRLKPKGSFPGIQVIKEYGNLPSVECYAGQINQVFMNLLANAIDALEESFASADIDDAQTATSECKIPTIGIRTFVSAAGAIVVAISDNGPGIPEEVRNKLFDPFFTTKPVGKGTGLGLSISYQIVVEKHGGKLSCLSEPAQGTEFIMELPSRPQPDPLNTQS